MLTIFIPVAEDYDVAKSCYTFLKKTLDDTFLDNCTADGRITTSGESGLSRLSCRVSSESLLIALGDLRMFF